MIDVKRCASCMRMLCVSEFDFQKNNNGRKRRKGTCRSCLGRQKERRDNKPAIDTRDIKLELERAIHEGYPISVLEMWRR